MKKLFLFFFSFLFFFFLRIDSYAYDEQLTIKNIRDSLYNDSFFNGLQDTVIIRQKDLSVHNGKSAYYYVVYNFNIFAKAGSIYHDGGYIYNIMVDAETDKVVNFERKIQKADHYSTSFFYFNIVDFDNSKKSYRIEEYKDRPSDNFELIEIKLVLEDVLYKKKFFLERRDFLIGLLIKGMKGILLMIIQILKMAIPVSIFLVSLIGSIRYFKQLLSCLRRC